MAGSARAPTASLIDLDNGVISREIFRSQEIFEQELERVFARAWLFVGHETQVPNPGDYFVSAMGDESVILTRDRSGKIHVLLNTCRHRGMKVCRYDEGNGLQFTCPYHGWSYGIDGKLVGVPYFTEAYRERLDKAEWGLIEVAQVTSYKGSIWATWDPDAPPFLDYLGGMKLWLDPLFDYQDGREAGAEVIGGVQKWRIPCNWKFVAENFIGDMHHTPSHVSVERVEILARGQTRHGAARGESSRDGGLVSFPELGHGARGSYSYEERPPRRPDDPVVAEYYHRVWQKRQARLGNGLRGEGGGGVFPNFSFHSGFPRTIAVSHPLGALQTEMWRWFLVDRDAPQEVKDFLRHYFLRYSGPGGLTEQDDMENWSYAAAASRGTIARRYPYNYSMGLGLTNPVDAIPGAVVTEESQSEENARTFYRRWSQLMNAESWQQLRP